MADGQQSTVPLPPSATPPPQQQGGDLGASGFAQTMEQINKAFGIRETPGANVPYTTQTTAADVAAAVRLPQQPRVREMQQQQAIPYGGTTDQIRGAEFGNLMGTVSNAFSRFANQKAQEKYQGQVGTIRDFTNALVKLKEAQKVLQHDGNNAEAQQVFRDNKAIIDKIRGDNAQWKVIEKSMPNYIDPSENNKPEVRAGQQAIGEVQQGDKTGLNNNNPAEARVSQMADTLAGKPVMGQQPQGLPGQAPANVGNMATYRPPVNLPQSIVENPAYAQQQKYLETQAEKFMQYILPAQIRAENAAGIAAAKNATTLAKDWADNITRANISDDKISSTEKIAASKAARELYMQEQKLNAIGKYAGNPRLGGIAANAALKELQTINSTINSTQSAIAKDTQDIDRMETDLDESRKRGETARTQWLEDQVNAAKARIERNGQMIDSLNDMRTKASSMITQTPTPGQLPSEGAGGTGGVPSVGGVSAIPGVGAGGSAPSMGGGSTGTANLSGITGGIGKLSSDQLAPIITDAASKNNLPENLIASVIKQESGGNPRIPSSESDRIGMMQISQAVADRFAGKGADRKDPAKNIQAGTGYLAWLLDRYNGDASKMLAGYFAGEGNLDKAGGDINRLPTDFKYRDKNGQEKTMNLRQKTQNYVNSVLAEYDRRSGGGDTSGGGAAVSTGQQPAGGSPTVAQGPTTTSPQAGGQASSSTTPAVPSNELGIINNLFGSKSGTVTAGP